MELVINHTRYQLSPIQPFRAEHHLPEIFGVAYFEPKDETGLASIEGAGDAFIALRNATLQAIPPLLTALPNLDFLSHQAKLFKDTLYAVNAQIGLKHVEIDYAVGGFEDVLNIWYYDQMRALQTQTSPTPFDMLYDDWLAQSGRRSEKVHTYAHADKIWAIRILNNAYGRVGIQVDMPEKTVYLQDTVYMCPAERFMRMLLRDMTNKLTIRPSI